MRPGKFSALAQTRLTSRRFWRILKLRYQTTTYEPYQPYRDVLCNTLAQMMERYGLRATDEDGEALLAAVRT